jgi:hypothetical protein
MIDGGYRTFGKGTMRTSSMKFLEDTKVKTLDVTKEVIDAGGRTAKSVVAAVDPSKNYIAFTSSHVLAIVKGKVEDWTDGRLHRVTNVLQVGPGKPGKITKVRPDDRAFTLLEEVESLTSNFGLHVSGPVVRAVWHEMGNRMVCYIGQSKGEGLLSFSKTNGLDVRLDEGNFDKATKRHLNYRYPSLEAAVKALDEAAIHSL